MASFLFFFFNDTAPTEIYPLSLHDALPIPHPAVVAGVLLAQAHGQPDHARLRRYRPRSEEHTSELQSQSNLVCRLLLEKKKQNTPVTPIPNGTIRHTVGEALLLKNATTAPL